MFSSRWNWKKMFSYGEVICFISAWAIGLLAAAQQNQAANERNMTRTFATASEVSGIQAKLSH